MLQKSVLRQTAKAFREKIPDQLREKYHNKIYSNFNTIFPKLYHFIQSETMSNVPHTPTHKT